MTITTITLAGRALPVQELTFAQLKRLLPAINRVARAMAVGRLEEAEMDDMGAILCAATGLSAAELDALPVKGWEILPAFTAIVTLAGLDAAGGTGSGEAVASAGTGTISTPTSPPASDGTGTA